MQTEDSLKLIQLGQSLAPIKDEKTGREFVVLSERQRLEDLDFLLEEPRRIKKQFSLSTELSFTQYVDKFLRPETIFLCMKSHPYIHAIIDYHDKVDEKDLPSFCTHLVDYKPVHSIEWNRWTNTCGKKMTQVAFAEFIEDNIKDVVEPDSAQLFTDITNFRLIRRATFGSKINVQNGEIDFQYSNESEKNGSVKLPETLTLGIRVFEEGEYYNVNVKLRYRVDEDEGLVLWYEITNQDKVYDYAFNKIVERLTEKYSDNLVLNS